MKKLCAISTACEKIHIFTLATCDWLFLLLRHSIDLQAAKKRFFPTCLLSSWKYLTANVLDCRISLSLFLLTMTICLSMMAYSTRERNTRSIQANSQTCMFATNKVVFFHFVSNGCYTAKPALMFRMILLLS